MSNVVLQVHHPQMGALSDRTIRSLLRRCSAILRKALEEDFRDFLRTQDLEQGERQSLRDRIIPHLGNHPAYYYDRLEQGSLTFTVIASATTFWLLKNTVGESVKEAWKRSDLHRKLVAYLANGQHQENVANHVSFYARRDRWSDWFLVEEVTVEPTSEGDRMVIIRLSTPEEIAGVIDSERKITARYVLEQAESEPDGGASEGEGRNA